MVPAKRCFESTRAASSVPASPLALSLAPGASEVASITSLTRLSMSPDMMTTRSGSSVPRWIAMTFTISVGSGMRGAGPTTPATRRTSRQPPQDAEIRRNSSSIQRVAAPMPRLGSVLLESVWRVPKETSVRTSRSIRSGETARTSSCSSGCSDGGAGGGEVSCAAAAVPPANPAIASAAAQAAAAQTGRWWRMIALPYRSDSNAAGRAQSWGFRLR